MRTELYEVQWKWFKQKFKPVATIDFEKENIPTIGDAIWLDSVYVVNKRVFKVEKNGETYVILFIIKCGK